MVSRVAFVDEVALAREFATDDVVRKTTHSDSLWTPYSGRVLYSDHQTGKVMVQWPWGPENEQPSELIRDASGDARPPLLLDQLPFTVERIQHSNSDADFKLDEKYRKSLSGTISERILAEYRYNNRISSISVEFEKKLTPVKIAACKLFHSSKSEIDCFLDLTSHFSSEFGSEPIRLIVSNLFGLAKRFAIYWKDTNRRYKVTQQERESGKLKCPRCGSLPLKPKVYSQGKRILNCKSCGFSITPHDLV